MGSPRDEPSRGRHALIPLPAASSLGGEAPSPRAAARRHGSRGRAAGDPSESREQNQSIWCPRESKVLSNDQPLGKGRHRPLAVDRAPADDPAKPAVSMPALSSCDKKTIRIRIGKRLIPARAGTFPLAQSSLCIEALGLPAATQQHSRSPRGASGESTRGMRRSPPKEPTKATRSATCVAKKRHQAQQKSRRRPREAIGSGAKAASRPLGTCRHDRPPSSQVASKKDEHRMGQSPLAGERASSRQLPSSIALGPAAGQGSPIISVRKPRQNGSSSEPRIYGGRGKRQT